MLFLPLDHDVAILTMPQGISNGHLILFRRRYTQTIRLLKHRILSSDIHTVLLRMLLSSLYELEKSMQIIYFKSIDFLSPLSEYKKQIVLS